MRETESTLQQLDDLLSKAELAARSLDGLDWATRFRTPDGFGDAIADARNRIHAGDSSGLHDLGIIFGPTGAWDDEIGAQGMELADQVLLLLNGLRKEMAATSSTRMK